MWFSFFFCEAVVSWVRLHGYWIGNNAIAVIPLASVSSSVSDYSGSII